MPRKAKTIEVVMTRKVRLYEGVQECSECGCEFKWAHYSAHHPTRCPPCKVKVRNAARRASYHKAKGEAEKEKAKAKRSAKK